MPWTDEEIKRLKELSRTKSIAEAAKEIGKTRDQAYDMASKLGIKSIAAPPKSDPKQDEEIFLFSESSGVRSAAERFKITEPMVKKARARHKLRIGHYSKKKVTRL